MSTTIDQRVVEMRFDNKQFESATRESISTLDKLKQSLNLTGASKGLEDINAAAKNNNMSVLGNAVETVHAKFSALEVMGMTCLANITNSAMNAGKRLAAAFTIDPLKTGFNEYELKMGSIQTIMAGTGESLETVNKYLNELNTYSDKTIYSFSDMTNNIGKFTNAGVKLEDAVLAIKGISNEAAVSGATANEASRAMYNFSQALSAGYVKLIDWKSIENANMATVEFKQQLIETAVACGTLTKTADGMYDTGKTVISSTKNFNDSLQDQWMTTEVLTKTLSNYATDVREMTAAEKKAYEEKLRGQGYTEEQIKNIEELGKKAYDSAQDIKTFSMMMDTLKEAAQSGWAQTWELIFGDFEQGKKLWTSLGTFFGGIIDNISKARNTLIESALGKSFTGLVDNVKKIIDPIKKSADSVKEVVKSVEQYSEVVNEILGGKWGNGQERWDKLTKAGYDWAHAQNLVNEKLGNGVRHATNYAEAQKGVAASQGESAKSQDKMSKSTTDYIVELTKLSDAQLKEKGYTDEQIKAFRDLAEAADKTGIPLKEFIDNIDEIDGRWLLLNSFKNVGQSIVTIFKSIGEAWRDAFPPMTSDQLFNIIAGLHKFSTYLVIDKETAENLTRTLKGLFAVLDIFLTITAGPLKIAFKALTQLLSAFDMNILDLTAIIGDNIVKFRDWLDSVLDFSGAFKIIAPYITSAANAIRTWIDKNIDFSAWIKKIEGYLTDFTKSIRDWIDGLKETDDVPKYIMDTLSKGFSSLKDFIVQELKEIGSKMLNSIIEWSLLDWASVPNDIIAGFNKGFIWGILSVLKNIRTFCTKIITTVKDIFGIHSPSRVMYEIGRNLIEGFINGVTAMVSGAVNAIKNIFTKCREGASDGSDALGKIFDTVVGGVKNFGSKIAKIFGKIDLGKVFAAALGVGMLLVAKKALDVLEMFGKPLEGIGNMLSGIGEAFEGFGKNLKANAMLKKAKALAIMAAAIWILVMALMPLADLEWSQLGKLGASLAFITACLVGLSLALGKIGSVDIKFSANMLMIAGALGLMAWVIKSIVQSVKECGDIKTTLIMLAAMIGGLASIMLLFGVFVNADKAGNMDKAGMMMFKMAAALLTMASVVKIVSGFTYSDIIKGLAFTAGVGMLFAAVVVVSKFAGEHGNKAGAMLWRMSIAMLIMAGVVKIASGFSNEELLRGFAFVMGVGLLFSALVSVSYFAGEHASKAGSMLLRMSLAVLIMAGVIKLTSSMSLKDVAKGTAVVIAIEALFVALIKASKYAGKHALQAGAMLLLMSIALGILVGITYIVSKLDAKEMWKALPFVAALEMLFAGLIAITKYAKTTKQMQTTLILLLVAVALMVAAVAGLSFIDPKSLASATAAITSVIGMFAALMVATKYTKNTKDMRKSLASLLGVTIVLALIIAGLSKLDPDSALESSAALSLLLLSFSSSILILGKTDRVLKTAMDALKPMLLIALGLGAILAAMSFIPQSNIPSLIASSVALSILLNAFSVSILILSKTGSISKSAIESLKPMLLIAAGLGLILSIMSFLPQANIQSMIASSISLSILLNAFSSAIVILSKAGRVSQSALAALQPMVLVTAELAVILGLMSALNVEASIPSAIALGILVNALAVSLVILQFVGPTATAAIPAAICMGLVLIELSVAMGIMASMNVQSAIPYAISLSILLLTLTGVAGLLGLMAPLMASAIPAVISLGIVIAELALVIAAIGAISQIPGLEWLISEGGNFLQSLGTALGQFVGGIVGGIASGAAAALPVIGESLSAFMNAVQGFITGAQSINENVLAGVGYLSAAILLLTVADFIAGIVTLGGIGLVALGHCLTDFILAALPFIATIQTINPTAVEAAKTLAEMILVLTAADLIQGITSFLTGNADFSRFGPQLEAFGTAICNFSNTLKANGGIDSTAVEAASNAGLAMSKLANSIPKSDGFLQDVIGEADLEKFGSMCEAFGKAIKRMSASLTGEDGSVLINQSAIDSAVAAGKGMADVAKAIPRSDGFLQDVIGESDLERFGLMCEAFGKAIKRMSAALTGEDGAVLINQTAIDAACTAGTAMSKLAKSLPKSDGFLQDVVGEQDLAEFGDRCKAFGEALKTMSESLTGEKGTVLINDEVISSVSKSGTLMAEVQAAIPEDKWLDGKISIDDFGKKIVKFGEGLVDYSEKVSEVDDEAVSSSLTSARRLVSIAQSVVDLDTSGIDSFKDVKGIGSALKDYADKISDVDSGSIVSSIANTRRLVSLITSMAALDTSGVDKFKSAINSLATTDMTKFVNAFKNVSKFTSVGSSIVDAIRNGMVSKQGSLVTVGNALVNNLSNGIISRSPSVVSAMTKIISNTLAAITSKKEAFYTIGAMLIMRLSSGMLSQSSNVKKAATSVLSSAVSGLKGYYSDFYDAGSYLVDGFASGISANTFKSTAQAVAMANAAAEAAKEALKINSPSKVFRSIGYSVPEGFAMGIDRLSNMAKDSAVAMGDVALDGLKGSIARIAEAVNTDIDSQPSIRPVLDLSDVEAGASAISGLFNNGASVDVLANVGSIGSLMNRKGQNGVNDELITAINKLRGDLNNIGNTYYTIDGITYSEGSEISEAVSSLTRAMKVERRI